MWGGGGGREGGVSWTTCHQPLPPPSKALHTSSLLWHNFRTALTLPPFPSVLLQEKKKKRDKDVIVGDSKGEHCMLTPVKHAKGLRHISRT